MKQHVLASQHFKKINMRRQRRIARRLKWPVPELGKRIIRYQRHEVGHRKWAVEFVSVSLCQIEEPQQQFENVFWTIGFHFEADGLAAARSPQLLFDAT